MSQRLPQIPFDITLQNCVHQHKNYLAQKCQKYWLDMDRVDVEIKLCVKSGDKGMRVEGGGRVGRQ